MSNVSSRSIQSQSRRRQGYKHLHEELSSYGSILQIIPRGYIPCSNNHNCKEIAEHLRVHGTTGEAPLERFERAEAQALQPLEAKPSFLAERELVRIVHSDCCVEVEANWYSAPQALIRQRVSVLVRDQQVLIRYGPY